jgi:hypothetical protein
MHSRAVLLAFNYNNDVFFSGVHNVRLPRHRKSKLEPGMSTTPPAAESMPPTAVTSSDDDDTADAAPTKDEHISTADTPLVFETITTGLLDPSLVGTRLSIGCLGQCA